MVRAMFIRSYIWGKGGGVEGGGVRQGERRREVTTFTSSNLFLSLPLSLAASVRASLARSVALR